MAHRHTMNDAMRGKGQRLLTKLRTGVSIYVGCLALSYGSEAAAFQPIGAEGEPIRTSDYTIDLYQGSVLGGPRVMALAGAYTAVAEGVDGYYYNPAAVALRQPWSTEWFDADFDFGIAMPMKLVHFDLDNSGDDRFINGAAFMLRAGLGLKFGDFALGLTVDWHRFHVESQSDVERELSVNVVQPMLLAAYSFLDGELLTGIGLSLHNVRIMHTEGSLLDRTVGLVTGGALHLGVLWAPAYLPLRVGLSTRFSPPPSLALDPTPSCEPPHCQQTGGHYISDGYYLPKTITLPSELNAGIAFQFFRPLNFPWVNPHEEDSEQRRVEAVIEREQQQREEAAERRLAQAKQAGEDLEQVTEQLEHAAELAEDAEDQRLEAAKQADRKRRLHAYRSAPRERLLVSLGVKITNALSNGVGLESFLEQRVRRSGRSLTAQPSLGVEAEVVPNYLVLQAGSYVEPSRFETGSHRVHGTGGFVVHIPVEWSVFGLLPEDTSFKIAGSVDGSVRYFAWGATAGIWR